MSDSSAYDELEHVSSVRQVAELLRQAREMMERVRAGEEIPLEERIAFQRLKVDTLRRVIDRTPGHHLTDEEDLLAKAVQELRDLRLEADRAGLGHVG